MFRCNVILGTEASCIVLLAFVVFVEYMFELLRSLLFWFYFLFVGDKLLLKVIRYLLIV